MTGAVLYIVAGLIGVLPQPVAALVIFFLFPLLHGVTSHGLTGPPEAARRMLQDC